MSTALDWLDVGFFRLWRINPTYQNRSGEMPIRVRSKPNVNELLWAIDPKFFNLVMPETTELTALFIALKII